MARGQTMIRVDDEIYAQVVEAAELEQRSVANMVAKLLREALETRLYVWGSLSPDPTKARRE